MAGMAAAEAAPWLVVRLRAVLLRRILLVWAIGLRGAHSGLLVCSASVCEN